MHKIAKLSTVLFLVLTLILIPFGSAVFAQDEVEDTDLPGKMMFDILVARPLGITATLLGTAGFIVSLPFSALGGNMKEAYKNLIAKPAKHAFRRPLGEF